jgi:hypothetical protein
MWSAPDAPNPPVSTYDPDPDLTTLWELWSGNDSCALIEDDHLSASSNMRCVLIQLYFSLCLLSSLSLSVSLSLALYSLSLSFLLKQVGAPTVPSAVIIRSFQKRNFTQSSKCSSLNLALTAPTAQAKIFGQNRADRQH